MMPKQELRRFYQELRQNLSEREKLSEAICRQVLSASWYRQADTLLCYAASGSEMNVSRVAEDALMKGKTVCFPRCLDTMGNMKFYRVNSLADLELGMYNIFEPKQSCVEWYPGNEHALCLVPGLAFDINGYRLGYGKGYYDRFLSRFSGVRVGICPKCLLLDEQAWKYDRYDIFVQWIVTQNTVYSIGITEDV